MSEPLLAADRVVLLLSLVPYLREHGPTSVEELSAAFDVDAETLRSLITFLGTAGVPGETLTSQHEDMFDIDWVGFEEHDEVSLTNIVAIDDTPRFASSETASLIAGLQALTTMLPAREAEAAKGLAEKLGQALGADERPSAVSITAEPQDPRLQTVFTALQHGVQLEFQYRDARGSESRRRVEPIDLVQGEGTWYLRAFCLDRDAERHFRLDRMSELQLLDAPAQRSQSARDGEGDPSRDPAVSGTVTVTARVRDRALTRIADFQPQQHGSAEQGWVQISLLLEDPRTAVAVVQRAPEDIVIQEPAAARDAVRDWADRALAQYDV